MSISVHNGCNITRQAVPECRSRVRESAFSDLATKGLQFVPGAGGANDLRRLRFGICAIAVSISLT